MCIYSDVVAAPSWINGLEARLYGPNANKSWNINKNNNKLRQHKQTNEQFAESNEIALH